VIQHLMTFYSARLLNTPLLRHNEAKTMVLPIIGICISIGYSDIISGRILAEKL
jgi:hypothetical protein